jgi:hypothetical protein
VAHKLPLTVWVIWFKDHIHTDANQQLAVFPRRKDATAWLQQHGIWDCKVKRLRIEN